MTDWKGRLKGLFRIAQKENEAEKDRTIQTFKAEHEKMNEEEEEAKVMEELEKALNESTQGH